MFTSVPSLTAILFKEYQAGGCISVLQISPAQPGNFTGVGTSNWTYTANLYIDSREVSKKGNDSKSIMYTEKGAINLENQCCPTNIG